MPSRIIRMAPDIVPDPDLNGGTKLGEKVGYKRPLLEHAFREAWAALAPILARHRRPGVVLVAVDLRGEVRGEVWLEATGPARTATIGRHSHADLYLDRDDELSLRHVLILVRSVDGETRVRLTDLRTSRGLADQRGSAVGTVETAGPLALSASQHTLFVFPTPLRDLPAGDSRVAWQLLSARSGELILCAGPGTASAELLRPAAPGASGSCQTMPGVVSMAEALVAADETACGHLVFRFEEHEEYLSVGARALERGVLLGRYRRCDGHRLIALRDCSISRVHGLVVQLDGGVYWVDTASTNGTRYEGRRVRVQDLAHPAQLELPNGVRVAWQWSM